MIQVVIIIIIIKNGFYVSKLIIFFLEFLCILEMNVDGENNLRKRSRKKSMSGSGAKEHKEQLEKLQQKVRLVVLLLIKYIHVSITIYVV